MAADRLVSILGLAFGDCGKGLYTDHLCRVWNAHTIVRFNGGAQAGHNVVLPDGRHHTFSQFGSGTFQPGARTFLAHPVIVHPTALLVEAEYLRRSGVPDALARLSIDPRCRLTTPLHQAAGKVRELLRGQNFHGTCGVGIGETVHQSILSPEDTMHFQDLNHPTLAKEKLEALRSRLLAELDGDPGPPDLETERLVLRDPSINELWLQQTCALLSQVPEVSENALSERLHGPGTVIFEGAQGFLLDEWHGFHPHTTWSSPRPASVDALVQEAGLQTKVHHFGVLRSYLTRHGRGPLPTEDPALDCLGETHNSNKGWQGQFRRGHPDAVLLRYAMTVAGPLDGLLVTHLDVFDKDRALNWCEGYRAPLQPGDETLCIRPSGNHEIVADLKWNAAHDLTHQAKLTDFINTVKPMFEGPVGSATELLERVESTTKCHVFLGSNGPSQSSIQGLRPFLVS